MLTRVLPEEFLYTYPLLWGGKCYQLLAWHARFVAGGVVPLP